MTYLEIYNELCRIVWGDTNPPASVTSLVLGVGTTTTSISSTAFYYRIGGLPYSKAAVAAGTAFSAANTINTGAVAGYYWGAWLVQINTSGTISTKPAGGLSDQVYSTEALAIAALPDPDADNVEMGYVTVKTKSATAWTANTDDLTDASDCTEANFYSSIGGAYKGENGVIARTRKHLQESFNYWFMERETPISLLENEIEYDLDADFKQEIAVMYYDADSEVYKELDKLNQREFTDYLKENSITSLLGDYVSVGTTLSIGSTPENIASTAFRYRINGTSYSKAAVAAGTAFTSADTINTGGAAGTFWGVWLVQVNTSGTISTKSPSSDQVYTTEALAIAALPDPDTSNIQIGYVTVNSNDTTTWTAGTDDLTDGSDCVEANFYSTDDDIENAECPLYYYIAPQTTTYRKIMFLPVVDDDITDGIYIRHYSYLADLPEETGEWDETEDYFSRECPELLIWAAVRDVAMTQRDATLLQTASNNMMLFEKLVKSKDWNYRIANTSKIPYKDV